MVYRNLLTNWVTIGQINSRLDGPICLFCGIDFWPVFTVTFLKLIYRGYIRVRSSILIDHGENPFPILFSNGLRVYI